MAEVDAGAGRTHVFLGDIVVYSRRLVVTEPVLTSATVQDVRRIAVDTFVRSELDEREVCWRWIGRTMNCTRRSFQSLSCSSRVLLGHR